MLLTKLNRPHVTKEHVFRNHLIDLLDNNRYKPFTLVSASAGYGKSMLISSWLERSKKKYGWISLDEEDNDIRNFVQYVIKSIQIEFPGTLEKSEKLVNGLELPPYRVLWEELINEMDEAITKSFVLVLDDYHLIKESKIHAFIKLYLKFPPEMMHLVVIARYDPPLDLTSLRAHSRINEIRMNDLAFQPNDIIYLFKKQSKIKLGNELVDTLYKTTEGWIVGLRMTSLAIQTEEEANSVIKGLSKGQFNISEFLEQQVLMKQPEEFQELLAKLSILDRFCAQIIDDIFVSDILLSTIGGEDFIDWLVRNNMFVIELDLEKKWFRFHHVFKDLLQDHLRLVLSDEMIKRYQIRASNWFDSQDSVDEAIHYARIASDYKTIIEIVGRRRLVEIMADRWYNIERWLLQVPNEIQKNNPELLLSKAWIAYQQTRIEIIVEVLNMLDSNHSMKNASPGIRGEVDFFKGTVEYFSGNGKLSCKYLESAIKKLGPLKNLILGETQLMYALSLVMTNKKDIAISMLDECVRSSGTNDTMYLTRITAGLAFVNVISGDLVKAKNTVISLRKLSYSSQSQYAIAWGNYLSGWVAFNGFQIDEAIDFFKATIEKRFMSDMILTMNAFYGLIISYGLSNRFNDAKKSIAELRKFIRQRGIVEFESFADSCQLHLDVLKGNENQLLPILLKKQQEYEPMEVFLWLNNPLIDCCSVHIKYGNKKDIEKAIERLCLIQDSIKTVNFRCQELHVILLKVAALYKLGRYQEAQESMSEALDMAEDQSWLRPFIELNDLILPVLKERIENISSTPFISEIFRLTGQLNTAQKNSKSFENVESSMQKNDNLLTIREIEILNLVAEGYRNKEIADKIFISLDGVKKHLYRIFQKLDVKSRIELVNKGIEVGLISSQKLFSL